MVSIVLNTIAAGIIHNIDEVEDKRYNLITLLINAIVLYCLSYKLVKYAALTGFVLSIIYLVILVYVILSEVNRGDDDNIDFKYLMITLSLGVIAFVIFCVIKILKKPLDVEKCKTTTLENILWPGSGAPNDIKDKTQSKINELDTLWNTDKEAYGKTLKTIKADLKHHSEKYPNYYSLRATLDGQVGKRDDDTIGTLLSEITRIKHIRGKYTPELVKKINDINYIA